LKLEADGHCQYRAVDGGSGFGCLPFEQHFGLGRLNRIDALEIHWPSGMKQRFQDLPVNDSIEFVEGSREWRRVYARKPERDRARPEKSERVEPIPAVAAPYVAV
jgi:hypothetical protein